MSGQRTRQKTGQRPKQDIGKKKTDKKGPRDRKKFGRKIGQKIVQKKRNDRAKKWDEKTEHYMAAWGYESRVSEANE